MGVNPHYLLNWDDPPSTFLPRNSSHKMRAWNKSLGGDPFTTKWG